MKHRLALAVTLLVLAGCGTGTNNATPATGDNAQSSTITLETPSGTPVPNTPVAFSTDLENNAPVNVLMTGITNGNGQVTFSNIAAQGVFCVSATITVANAATFVGQCVAPFPSAFTLN